MKRKVIPDKPVSIPQKKKVTVTIDEKLPQRNKRTARRTTFDKCRLELAGFKFNRNEANNYDFQLFDSIIAASALEAGCDILYSEDMHHGQVIEDRLTILNSFI